MSVNNENFKLSNLNDLEEGEISDSNHENLNLIVF